MKFSIIMAAFNAEKSIKKSIESVINQKFSDYEFIIINDCSTDNTQNIVSQYENIRLINNKVNLKAGGARNVGLNNAKGEYILFLDADDIFIDNNILKKINDNIELTKYPDIVYLGFATDLKQVLPNKENSNKNKRIEEWKYANVWDVCWKREFLNKNNIRFIENRYFEDFAFYYEGVVKSNLFSFIDEPIIKYTIEQNDSMTGKMTINKINDLYFNMSKLLRIYEQIDDKDLRKSFEKGALLRQHENITYYMKKMICIDM